MADPNDRHGSAPEPQLARCPQTASASRSTAAYNRNDGFSPGALIVTKVPGLETQEAFDGTGAVPITDMARAFEPRQPWWCINARTRKRHLVWAEIDSNPAAPRT